MITLNGDSGITAPTYGGTVASEYHVPVTAFKNRIINGAMQIDQRNAGASVTPAASAYLVDRFRVGIAGAASKYSFQQTTTAPDGFSNSLLATVVSAYSVTATDIISLQQSIEGYNVADLGWGTANAKTVTLSFWVKSSVTGTFGGSFVCQGATPSYYPFTYTINTTGWEQKTITVTGPTTNAGYTDSNAGIIVYWSLGVGSTYTGTAGSWGTTQYRNATGAVSLVATAGATFYITGVQLEKGSTATSFDYRPYGTELSLCQRYFFSVNAIAVSGQAVSTTAAVFSIRPPVTMRANPTCTYRNQDRITNPTVLDYSGTYVGSTRLTSQDNIGFTYTRTSGSTWSANIPLSLNDTTTVSTITGDSEL